MLDGFAAIDEDQRVTLDVYVGSLTRYYLGDWETVVQQAARVAGHEVLVIGPDMDPDDPGIADERSANDVTRAVLEWREPLGAALGLRLDWREDPTTPYLTDKPAWEGYGSLQVLAAAVERGERNLPAVAAARWHEVEVWRQAADAPQPRFNHVYLPELWLPVDFEHVMAGANAGGKEINVGSSVRLLSDLRTINEATFRGSDEEIAAWRVAGATVGGPFEEAARFGLAVFTELAAGSVRERLPICLDY